MHLYLPDLVIFELKHDSLTEVKGNHIHIQSTAGLLCQEKANKKCSCVFSMQSNFILKQHD